MNAPENTPAPDAAVGGGLLAAANKLTRTLNCAPAKMVAAFGTDATDGLRELTEALIQTETVATAGDERDVLLYLARNTIARERGALRPTDWKPMSAEAIVRILSAD